MISKLVTIAAALAINPVSLFGGAKPKRKAKYPFTRAERKELDQLAGKAKKARVAELKAKYSGVKTK